MSTSIDVAFDVVFSGIYYFRNTLNFFNGRKMRFPASSQTSIFEKLTFGEFEVKFLNVSFFPWAGVVYCYYK